MEDKQFENYLAEEVKRMCSKQFRPSSQLFFVLFRPQGKTFG